MLNTKNIYLNFRTKGSAGDVGGNRRIRWIVPVMVILMMLFVSACEGGGGKKAEEKPQGSTETPGQSSNAEPAKEAEPSGSTNDLVVAWLSDPPSMDPHMATDQQTSVMTTHLYDTLVKHDKDLNIQPGLAESWKP